MFSGTEYKSLSSMKKLHRFVTNTALRDILLLDNASLKRRPLGPTNGTPSINSCLAGAIPIDARRALRGPLAGTRLSVNIKIVFEGLWRHVVMKELVFATYLSQIIILSRTYYGMNHELATTAITI